MTSEQSGEKAELQRGDLGPLLMAAAAQLRELRLQEFNATVSHLGALLIRMGQEASKSAAALARALKTDA